MEPEDLYEISASGRRQVEDGLASHGPLVLLDLVRGFMDAGGASRVIEAHLLTEMNPIRVVTFDADLLLDYRSRRPTLVYENARWVEYNEPLLVIDLLHDAAGTPFLALRGVEPDIAWERFIDAIMSLIDTLGIGLTMSVQGAPMKVPHTRPIGTSLHATTERLDPASPFEGRLEVPGSVSALLEYRLGQAGRDAGGVTVHVPHYLAGIDYPPGGLAGLRRLERATGLDLAAETLETSIASITWIDLDALPDGSELQEMLAELESEYDQREAQTEVPSADEIGQQVEDFLASRLDDDEPSA